MTFSFELLILVEGVVTTKFERGGFFGTKDRGALFSDIEWGWGWGTFSDLRILCFYYIWYTYVQRYSK